MRETVLQRVRQVIRLLVRCFRLRSFRRSTRPTLLGLPSRARFLEQLTSGLMSTRRKRVLYIYRVGCAVEPHSGLKRELMKLAFSTLGCPDWDVLRIAETAERLG